MHIAITGTINGENVEWMEKVTDEQYHGKRGFFLSATGRAH